MLLGLGLQPPEPGARSPQTGPFLAPTEPELDTEGEDPDAVLLWTDAGDTWWEPEAGAHLTRRDKPEDRLPLRVLLALDWSDVPFPARCQAHLPCWSPSWGRPPLGSGTMGPAVWRAENRSVGLHATTRLGAAKREHHDQR